MQRKVDDDRKPRVCHKLKSSVRTESWELFVMRTIKYNAREGHIERIWYPHIGTRITEQIRGSTECKNGEV